MKSLTDRIETRFSPIYSGGAGPTINYSAGGGPGEIQPKTRTKTPSPPGARNDHVLPAPGWGGIVAALRVAGGPLLYNIKACHKH